jgi:hypothetical protein
VTTYLRPSLSIVLGAMLSIGLSAQSPPMKPTEKSPAKKVPPTIVDLETNPGNFLGYRMTLPAMLGPVTKVSGSGAELSVFLDTQKPAKRVQYVASKSLAESISKFEGLRRVNLTGTVLDAESVRAGYLFEIDEIVVFDATGAIEMTLKPTIAPFPTFEPTTKSQPEPAQSLEPSKPAEASRKSGIPPALLIGAALMAVLLVILGIVGFRLMKYMKKKPAVSRQRLAIQAPLERSAS